MGKIVKPFDPDLLDIMQSIDMKVSVYFISNKGQKKKYIKIKKEVWDYHKSILYGGNYRYAYVFPSFNTYSRRYTDSVIAVLGKDGEIEACYLKNGEFYRMPEVHGDLFMSWTPISLSVNDNLNQNTLL